MSAERQMRRADLLDMRDKGVNEALLVRLDDLILQCSKGSEGSELDKILDGVHTSWRRRK